MINWKFDKKNLIKNTMPVEHINAKNTTTLYDWNCVNSKQNLYKMKIFLVKKVVDSNPLSNSWFLTGLTANQLKLLLLTLKYHKTILIFIKIKNYCIKRFLVDSSITQR